MKGSPQDTLVKALLPRLKLQTAQLEFIGLPPAHEQALADWLKSLPQPRRIGDTPITEMGLSVAADFKRWTWCAAGDPGVFIPVMADYLTRMGATQAELDRLSRTGEAWQPDLLGYWLEWKPTGLNAGWYLPLPTTLQQIRAILPSQADSEAVLSWAEANHIREALRVGRSMGGGNAYVDLTLALPVSPEIEETVLSGVQLFERLRAQVPTEEALGLLMNLEHGDLAVSVWLSEQGVVKAGLVADRPSLPLLLELCRLSGQTQPEALGALQGILDVDGPAYVECQTRPDGFMVEVGYQLDLQAGL